MIAWIIAGIATLAGAITAAMRQYKIGPWNPQIEPVEATVAPETAAPSPAPTNATLTNLCLGIKHREGANPLNNNPGNCRYYSGGYLPIYQPVKESPGGFAMFKDYATGWLYLMNTIKEKIHNHPDWTLLQLFENYAPAADGNNPVSYSQEVAIFMGVDNSFRIGSTMLV